MSDDEPFLARWSRRKREAAEEVAPPEAGPAPASALDPSPAEAAPTPEIPAAGTDASAPTPVPAEFDASTLPPLESIAADTDIRAYFARGVPEDLTRAALRRAWTSDPVIRDFIGIAENQWDFTAPDGVPGFGPLEMTDQMRRLIADTLGDMASPSRASVPETSHPQPHGESAEAPQLTGNARQIQSDPDRAAAADADGPSGDAGSSAASEAVPEPQSVSVETIVQGSNTDVVSHGEPGAAGESMASPRRSRGRALPV